jgi:hypothetical protein
LRNIVQPIVTKGKGPKRRNMPSKEKNSENPMDDSPPPCMQLRSSMRNVKENKSGKTSIFHPPALETP